MLTVTVSSPVPETNPIVIGSTATPPLSSNGAAAATGTGVVASSAHEEVQKVSGHNNSNSNSNRHVENARVLMATKNGSLTDVRSVLTSTGSPYQKMTMLDYADERGRTALHYAAESGKVRIVLLLLEQDSSGINKQDNEGNTPAHLAMLQGKEGMVVWLAKKGILLFDLGSHRRFMFILLLSCLFRSRPLQEEERQWEDGLRSGHSESHRVAST